MVLSKDDPAKDDALRTINEYVRDHAIPVKAIEIDVNSATRAWNEGIKNSNCNYVMVMPDDVYLNEKTITRALELLKGNDVAAVTYPAYPYGVQNPVDAPLNYKLHHLKFLGITSIINTVLFVTVFRKDILMKIGLYREDMGPPYTIHEDWELGSRIRSHGYRLIVDGTLKQFHLEDQSVDLAGDNEDHKNGGDKLGKLMRGIMGYVRQYVNKHWWSMYQVLKVGPLSQKLEYAWYIISPLLLISSLICGEYLYALLLIVATLITIELVNAVKGYYRAFGITQRITYPVITYIARNVRAYLFLAGLIKNVLKSRS